MKVPESGARIDKRGARPGERRGGKAVGTRDAATLKREKRLAEALQAATDAIGDEAIRLMSPKDVMLFVMRLAAQQGWWFKAAEIAKEAAPYIHPKLTSTTLDANVRRAVTDFNDDELEALARANIMIPQGDEDETVVN